MTMRFGFLAHPVGSGQQNLIRSAGLAAELLGDRAGWPAAPSPRTHLRVPMLQTVVSPTGARAEGDVRYLPYTAEDMLRRHDTALDVVTEEVRALAADGAAIVGLGGATAIVGDRGQRVADAVDVAVTSGNSLTAYAAYQTARQVTELLGLDPTETRMTVVGYPGSIGLVVTRLLLADGYPVDVVHRRGASSRDSLLRHLDPQVHDRVTLIPDPVIAYQRGQIFVAASSTGGLIDPQRLRPGTVVVDVALPRDVPRPPRNRPDILILDGGLVSTVESAALRVDDREVAPTRLLNGCLAETLVLALEGRAECWSLGRELSPQRVREIGELARRHGLHPTPLASYGRAIRVQDVLRLAPQHRPRGYPRTAPPGPTLGTGTVAGHAGNGSHAGAGTGSGDGGKPDPAVITRTTADRFRRHLNPPMATLLSGHGMDRVFTSGRAATLTTADGVDYLDFVAGYGCLNLGHNPPAVVDRLTRFLASGAPTFVQYISMPVHTAELAERLCQLAPGRLERVFFSNSGAESVEAALKLARAATGRTRLVYVENSYHGKTLGALSVTGRAIHRDPFGPLVGDCVAVPHGDLSALSAALDGAAAFIVEPVLGEGGVRLPPDGYLRGAQELCRANGAVFIVDEIQTGLGRTGALFACEHWDLRPDVLCLAKSLSGGLVPIGATLATAELWDAAYGSTGRSVLHTSTFGGGNLAAAAGLATLDVLEEQDIAGHAAKLGQHLRRGLAEVAERFTFIDEVRGIGMMNGIAFNADLSGALGAAVDDLLTRFPGDLHEIADLLDDETRTALARAARAVETSLGDLLCLRFVRRLAQDHQILTFVTANHSRVMRIQPPLVLTEHEADRFVDAVAAVASHSAFYADLAAR